MSLGELFSFISALYFRGKISYALHFGGAENTHVIAPGFGLVPPTWTLSEERLDAIKKRDVDLKDRKYVKTLRDSSVKLATKIDDETEVVLLGSVASGKYVDILAEVFGPRLKFPSEFIGRGDMSRGGLMLRSVDARAELTYIPISGAVRRGARPPKLAPRISSRS